MKIIVRMPNWLGDAVFNLPFLMKLSEKHEVTVVTKESLKELYFKFNTITFRNKEELYKKHLKLRGKYDAYIVTPVSFSSALAAYLARTRVRIGFSFDMRDSLLTKKIPIPKEWKQRHTTETYALLYSEFFSPSEVEFYMEIPKELCTKATKILEEYNLNRKTFIAIAPFTQFGTAKEWGEENYLNLVNLLSSIGIRTVILGTKSEIQRASYFKGNSIMNLAGKTSLWDAACIATHSLAFVGGDSGLTHLAALCGARTIAIFGPTPVEWTKPIGKTVETLYTKLPCTPCEKRECPKGIKACMNSVKPQEVFEIIRGPL
ncbi:MAG: lipopolysaccharide heptosyltransferase II [Candidatus Hydrothermia bacterium]|nr:lipopolysaccharide heptosyltransferase II [Candidatus Hydrothermae bacterium]